MSKDRFQPSFTLPPVHADLVLRTPPASWAKRIQLLTALWGNPEGDDLADVYRAVLSHQATVVVPADRFDDPLAILGAVCSRTTEVPFVDRTGRTSGARYSLPRLFGMFLVNGARHQGLAPFLIAIESCHTALKYEMARPVFAGAPIDNFPLQRALDRVGFWISSSESAQVALRRGPHQFSRFLSGRQAPEACLRRIAVLENDGLIHAAELAADLMQSGLPLPSEDVAAYWDVSDGRNAVTNLIFNVGRDIGGWRKRVGLVGFEAKWA